MYLLSRQVKILRYLKTKNRFVKGSELAKVLGVTDRTIRTDIATIKQVYGEEIILAVRTKGYLYNTEFQVHANFFYHLDISDSGNRMIYILKKLLLFPEAVNIFDLSEELSVSERSIETDIQRLKKTLHTLSLEMVSIKRTEDCVTLFGYETISNNLMYDVVKYTTDMLEPGEFQKFFIHINIDYLKGFLIQILNEFQYESRYLSLSRLLLDVALMIESVYVYGQSYGKKFYAMIQKANHEISQQHIELSIKIGNMVNIYFGVTLFPEDLQFIAYVVYTKHRMEWMEDEIRSSSMEKDEFYEFCVSILERLQSEKHIEFIEDDQITQNFIFHLKIAMKRMELGIKLYNPLSEKLTKEYTYVIDLAVMVADMIFEKYGIQFDFNEISYIGIYLATAIHNTYDRQRSMDRLKILLYVPEGIGNLNLIHRQMERMIDKDKVTIDGTTTIHTMLDVLLSYDMIFTTSNRINMDNHKIHVIHKRFDLASCQKIKDLIQHELDVLQQHKLKQMGGTFFDASIFLSDVSAKNKYDVISILCHALYENGYVNETFESLVLERESVVSTELETGVALPHAIKNTAYKSGMAVAFLKTPIIWDQQKVKFVFLYANSASTGRYDNMFTLYFVDAVSSPSFLDIIKDCRAVEEFVSCWITYCCKYM